MAQIALTQADIPSWSNFITQFDATYQLFYDNYNGLMMVGPYIQTVHPELLDEYNGILQRAAINANRLEQLKATRDYVYSWLQWLQSGVGNFETGAQAIYDYAKASLGLSGNGIGVIPLVPIYVVIGAAAAIATIYEIKQGIVEIYTIAQKVNMMKDAESKGASTDQATAMVNSVFGSPASGNFLGIPFQMLAFVALAIFLGPPIIKAITDGRR